MKGYSGRSAAPRKESIVYRCPCGERFAAEVWRAVSAADAVLRKRLIEGDLNRVRCPRCDAAADVQVAVVYHDVAQQRLVYVASTSERHRELALRAELFAMLAADAAPPPDYVLRAEVVFGAAGLSELLAEGAPRPVGRSETDVVTALHTPLSILDEATPAEPSSRPAPMATVPDLDAVLAATRAHREATAPKPVDRPAPADPAPIPAPVRADGDVAPPRPAATVAVPDPRTAVIERWIAARETDTALFVDDRVVVCAALPAATLEHFVGREGRKVRVALRPQLHRMSTFALVVLTFVAGDDRERPDEAHVFHVPLDLSRAAHRVALEQLQRRCALELELFDTEYLPVVSLTVTVPLEEHVQHLVAEAKIALERVPVATRSFERARAAFLSAGYDRLGRTAIDLPTLDEMTRATPAAVRTALHAVARWSEAAAESYLLEIRGFPLPVWRRLAVVVVRRAVEIGLFVPRALAERVARRARHAGALPAPHLTYVDVPPEAPDAALDLPQWPELVELQIRRFAELSARLRPSDLSPADEATNWEQLLREAEVQGIAIEDAVHRLAESAFERVGGRPSKRARSGAARPAGVAPAVRARPAATDGPPLSARPLEALTALLEDRDARLEAAVAIAARRDPASLPALFGVLRRMSRVEANALLGRLAAFGPPAERWLIEGLRSRKAFMRQGCALALGRVATPLAIDALARLLFDEPTEIWTEIARAIGDVGAPAVPALAARAREVEAAPGERSDRLVQALAHVAARTAEGGPAANRAAVEALATGRDALLANAARRALVLAPDVSSAHQAVRSARREQTLVRAFTRRFYDSLRADGEAEGDDVADLDELSSDELEALVDMDEDLLEELLEPDEPEPPRSPTAAPSSMTAAPSTTTKAANVANVGERPTSTLSLASLARRTPGPNGGG